MEEQKAVKALKEVKKVLDDHKITFWLNYGTLLGAIRDNKFIPWDTDIDLCLTGTHLFHLKLAALELERRGFIVKCKRREDFNHSITVTKYDIPIVLFLPRVYNKAYAFNYIIPRGNAGRMLDYLLWTFKLREPGITKNYGSVIPYNITNASVRICAKLPECIRQYISNIINIIYRKTDSYHIVEKVPSHFFEELKEIKFYGMKIKVPKKADDYLLFLYGRNWKKPIKNCIYGEDTKTIVQKCKYGELLKKSKII